MITPYQVTSEGVEGFLGLLHLLGRTLQHNLVGVGPELYVNLGQVLGDLLHVLSLAADDEAMQPLGGVDLFYGYTVGLLIHLRHTHTCAKTNKQPQVTNCWLHPECIFWLRV